MKVQGWEVWAPLDCFRGKGYEAGEDLRLPPVRGRVWQQLKDHAGPGFYLHVAVDCATWSILGVLNGNGRSKGTPWGNGEVPRVEEANVVTKFLLKCIRLVERSGGHWSLENPRSSFIWWTPELRRMQYQTKTQIVDFDQCEYGLDYPGAQKTTTLKKNQRVS